MNNNEGSDFSSNYKVEFEMIHIIIQYFTKLQNKGYNNMVGIIVRCIVSKKNECFHSMYCNICKCLTDC